jgi:hypothetical protein
MLATSTPESDPTYWLLLIESAFQDDRARLPSSVSLSCLTQSCNRPGARGKSRRPNVSSFGGAPCLSAPLLHPRGWATGEAAFIRASLEPPRMLLGWSASSCAANLSIPRAPAQAIARLAWSLNLCQVRRGFGVISMATGTEEQPPERPLQGQKAALRKAITSRLKALDDAYIAQQVTTTLEHMGKCYSSLTDYTQSLRGDPAQRACQ